MSTPWWFTITYGEDERLMDRPRHFHYVVGIAAGLFRSWVGARLLAQADERVLAPADGEEPRAGAGDGERLVGRREAEGPRCGRPAVEADAGRVWIDRRGALRPARQVFAVAAPVVENVGEGVAG